MDFKFNRNNEIINITLNGISEDVEIEISCIKIGDATKSYVENAVNNKGILKNQQEVVIDKIVIKASEYKKLEKGKRYALKGTAGMMKGECVSVFELYLGNIDFNFESPGNVDDNIITINGANMSMYPYGEYKCKELSD